MAVKQERRLLSKIPPLREGCYVQRLSDNGQPRRSGTIFACGKVSKSNKWKIQKVFGREQDKSKKYKKVSAAKLMPQTLIYYHSDCLKHAPLVWNEGFNHPERAERVSIPMRRLREYGLMRKCVVMKPKKATTEQILSCHSETHLLNIKQSQSSAVKHRGSQQTDQADHQQDGDGDTIISGNQPDHNVYCLCRQPYDATKPMVQCNVCSEWYHFQCIGFTAEMAQSLSFFECDQCKRRLIGTSESTYSTTSERGHSESQRKRKHNEMTSGWLNEDTFFNEYSFEAAQRAAGAAIGLLLRIATNRCQVPDVIHFCIFVFLKLKTFCIFPNQLHLLLSWLHVGSLPQNGIALVRPPGHHCQRDNAMGFCLINNVAVAVRIVQQKKLCQRILIVDWDVHHGNGLQSTFYDDDNVLYFSVHRFGDGFYPETGAIHEIGNGDAKGFNVNVPLRRIRGHQARYGDAAYLDIWKCILLPMATEFDPELIVIAAGFDSCISDKINQNVMAISPPCYGVLCRMLMSVCPKIAVILEGGYQLNTMSAAICYVTWSLLRGRAPPNSSKLDLNEYTSKELEMYIENTMWYKSVFFESEFRRFVLKKLASECAESFEALYRCNAEYDEEQKEDFTKKERRKVIRAVLGRHATRWKSLRVILKYLRSKD